MRLTARNQRRQALCCGAAICGLLHSNQNRSTSGRSCSRRLAHAGNTRQLLHTRCRRRRSTTGGFSIAPSSSRRAARGALEGPNARGGVLSTRRCTLRPRAQRAEHLFAGFCHRPHRGAFSHRWRKQPTLAEVMRPPSGLTGTSRVGGFMPSPAVAFGS